MPRLSKIGAAALAAFGFTSGGASTAVTASYLQVAGGGGGGSSATSQGGGGGGGAGGLLAGSTSLNPTLSYTVVVGAGGAGGIFSSSVQGSNGANSSITGLTASVGGGGGGGGSTSFNGLSGGSGGGGGYGQGTGGSATSGQGFAGATGTAGNSGAGGGGASAAGSTNPASNTAGAGGNGTASSISGSSVTYAGGGGGGGGITGGAGGTGGGGSGANGTAGSAISGIANTGGGGGGTYGALATAGGNGGSGVVIISYPAPQKFGGGIVTTSGSNVIHTFTTSGTLSPLSTLSASYLIVAGGAGGGGGYSGGGGGAGGMLTGAGVVIDTSSTYLVTVGAGGAGGAGVADYGGVGVNGGNSKFGIVSTTAIGGGGGGGWDLGTPSSGGSGGGGAYVANTGGAGTSGQGNRGGNSGNNSPYQGAGGGGAGAAGGDQTGSATQGGIGLTSSISGTSTYYAGGGSGGGIASAASGGGGYNGGAGTANTGGGGGGSNANNGGAGGSGVVIISYAGSTQQMAGGTVTISGGNVIHTFTSSGYLAPLKFVGNSLRFRQSASPYLTRNPSTPTAQNTWTLSAWVKRGQINSYETIMSDDNTGNGKNNQIQFKNDNTFLWYSDQATGNIFFQTNAVYRDPAAWYHIVLAVNSSASGSNKIRFYVNGSEVTSFSTDNRSSFSSSYINALGTMQILGAYYQSGSSGNNFGGYMAEVNFIDGQQLTPNAFGTFNSYGVWQPINYGGSYGTNGFYLPFTGSSSYVGSFTPNQYLNMSSSAFAVGTSSFTLESWFYITSGGLVQGIFSTENSAGGTDTGLNIRFDGSNYIYGAIGNGGAETTITNSVAVSLNKWNHVAFVRNGSALTLYLNGVSIATGTSSANVNATSGVIGRYYQNLSAYYFNGYISNVRLTNTAVYTSNFVPSTSSLTAIAGTQFLTCQSATFVDNSTNAISITNNGTATLSQTYPFTMLNGLSKDYSPAGNNWTNNNISVLSGSTLDVMTDVPTLTSATVANYCTWNPALGSHGTTPNINAVITNGNLTATDANNVTYNSGTSGTMGFTSGKWYWENTIGNSGPTFAGCGVSFLSGSDPNQYGLSFDAYTSSGAFRVFVNGTPTNIQTSLGTLTGGDVVAIALDCGAQTIAWYKNNVQLGTTVTYTGYLPTNATFIYPGFWTANQSGASVSTNFGQQPYKYTPPTGFVALNTYNL